MEIRLDTDDSGHVVCVTLIWHDQAGNLHAAQAVEGGVAAWVLLAAQDEDIKLVVNRLGTDGIAAQVPNSKPT